MTEIGAFAIVNNRICKITLCTCCSSSKRAYICCDDIETLKCYSLFVRDCKFELENFEEGDCSVTIFQSFDIAINQNYDIRSKDDTDNKKYDTENNMKNLTDMYAIDGTTLIVGCYLQEGTDIFQVVDLKIEKDLSKVYFRCINMHTKKVKIYEMLPKVGDDRMFKQDWLLEIGDNIVIEICAEKQICIFDRSHNRINIYL
jgi:hypothetical protein